MDRKAFLDQEPPPGYVAGIGRGATGFDTGADTGALRNGRPFDVLDDSDNEVDDNENSQGILGNKGSKEEEEADRVYEEIENRLRQRRKGVRVPEQLEQEQDDKIKQHFTDLKRSLANISGDQWANLPDAPDLAKRNKRMRLLEQLRQRFYAVPDSMIAAQSGAGTGISNTLSNDSNNPQLNSEHDVDGIETDIQMADIGRNRTILSSLRKTEPKKPSSWIASARLELQAKNYNAAKRFINEGCKRLPHNEAVWLENVKIHQNSTDGVKLAKIIVAEALKYNSRSENLWLKACELENISDIVSQRKVLMKGIEFIPNSVKLWAKMIEIQDEKDDVKKMLHKVIELCPHEWSFWLSLINLSNYDEAKSLINRARKAIKDNHQIWITAAKLEERENASVSDKKLVKMIEKGQQQLRENTNPDDLLSRRAWLDEAAKAESEGFTMTCKAIVFNSIDIGISENQDADDRLEIYFEEASFYLEKGATQTANFIYQYVIDKFPHDINSWVKFFNAFKSTKNFDIQDLYPYYEKAITLNEEEELFYLMHAKDKWKLEKDVAGARSILETALSKLPTKENIWHARIKFEIKTGNIDDANEISHRMLKKIPDLSPRIWYKHIHLQRYIHYKNPDDTFETRIMSLLDDAMSRFPDEEKLYLQKGQILLDDLHKAEDARECFLIGTNNLPNSTKLWISLSQLDEQHLKVIIRARSVLDRAIFKNPKSDLLWTEKIKLERRNNDMIAARQLCNKALKSFNSSPYIWLEYLSMIPKMSQRKNALLDALKATDNSAIILLNIGLFFLVDGKPDKARAWLERSLTSDRTNGDIWGWLYNYFSKYSKDSDHELTEFFDRFGQEEEFINSGDTWNKVSKEVKNLAKEPKEILLLVSQTLNQNSSI